MAVTKQSIAGGCRKRKYCGILKGLVKLSFSNIPDHRSFLENHLLFCGARFFSSGYRSYGEKRRAGIRQETKAGPARNKRERLPYSRSTKTGGSGIERRRLEAGTSALAGECEVYRRKERSFFRRHRYPLCTSRPPEVPGKRLPACLLNEM